MISSGARCENYKDIFLHFLLSDHRIYRPR
jgi:hypothetical protein